MLLLGMQPYRNAKVLSDADPICCKILGCHTLEISTDMGVAYRANSLVCYAHIFWENSVISAMRYRLAAIFWGSFSGDDAAGGLE